MNTKFTIYLLFLVPIVYFSSIQNADATPIIKVYDDTFKIEKISSVFSPPRPDARYSDTISLVNIGNETAILSWQISKIQLVSHSGVSGAPNTIDIEGKASDNFPKKFSIKPSFSKPIEPILDPNRKTSRVITMSMEIESDITSTYEGKIWVYGDGIESFPIKVEVKIIHNKFEFIIFALAGIGVALIFGAIESWRVLKQGKSTIGENSAEKIKVDLISRDTYWSVQINPFFKKKDKDKLPDKSPGTLFSYLLSRFTLGGLAVGLSLPAAIFGHEYFAGIPIIDVFIAAGIGFITYRAQDFKKLYRTDKSLG